MSYIDPTGKLIHHLDRIAAIKAGGQPAPVNVEIDLTNRCNLGCEGCHFAYTHTRGPLAKRPKPGGLLDMGDVMDGKLARSILAQLAAAGVRSVSWTGGGEPTLHPDFVGIIRDCPLPQGIYTNGTLIDTQRAAVMKQRMEWVYVSLDRHTRAAYQEYKKTDAFIAAMRGITNLVEAEGRATIGVGFLIGERNYRDVFEIVQFAQMLGVHYVQFRPEIHYNAAHPQERPAGLEWIDKAIERLRVVEDVPGVVVDISRFEMYRDWQAHPYPLCHWAQIQAVITPNGRVWTCVNRRGFEGDCLGDLSRETFSDVWARSQAKEVDGLCRVMCRGHIPNLTLTKAMRQPERHELFI